MSPRLVDAVAHALDVDVTAVARVGGGDVAESYRLELDDGHTVFAKTHRNPPPGFFTTEATGLDWLLAVGTVPVPRVLAVSDGDGEREPPMLVLEWIDVSNRRTEADETTFGRSLAQLHRAGAPSFGRSDRRTTGSRALPNEPCNTWAEFYATRRLEPLSRLAADGAALPDKTLALLADVTERLVELGGEPEPPARLHGDLWAGNRLVDRMGHSWLIDPAAHGGHREFDLAMMRLFGGFGDACFDAYEEEYALAEGWRERVPLHQLAPLVVHAIKFGGGYADATRRALGAIVP